MKSVLTVVKCVLAISGDLAFWKWSKLARKMVSSGQPKVHDLDGPFRYSFRIPFQMSIHEHTCTIGKSDSLLAGNLTVKTCMQQSFSRNISGNGIAWSLSSIYILVIQIAMFSTFRQIGCPCNQDSLSR